MMHYCPRCERPCYCHGDVTATVVEPKRYSADRCTCACETEREEIEDRRAVTSPPVVGTTLITLGDLFADVCGICGKRAYYGVASVVGLEGCREAVRRGQTYCRDHIPKLPVENRR